MSNSSPLHFWVLFALLVLTPLSLLGATAAFLFLLPAPYHATALIPLLLFVLLWHFTAGNTVAETGCILFIIALLAAILLPIAQHWRT